MRSRATSKARRVFPEPPAPVRVKSRVVASAWLTSNASSSRPTKLLRAVGRLCWGGASSPVCSRGAHNIWLPVMQSWLFPRNPRKYAALALWPREEVAFPTPIIMLPKKQSRIPQTDDLCVRCYQTVSERHLLASWQRTSQKSVQAKFD